MVINNSTDRFRTLEFGPIGGFFNKRKPGFYKRKPSQWGLNFIALLLNI